MNMQMISDADYQYHHSNTKSLSLNESTGSYEYPLLPEPPKVEQVPKRVRRPSISNSCCKVKLPKMMVIFLWLLSIASLSTIIYLYSHKKKFLLKKMQTLYLIGMTIISLMDICIGLIAILFLCSSFRFKQVLIFTNILKIAGFALQIFDYAEIQDRIEGDYPDFFLVNLYIESFSSLISFILLFYFIFASFGRH